MSAVIPSPNGGTFTLAPPPKPTSGAKAASYRDAMEAKALAKQIKRNVRTIAKEEARIAKGASTPPGTGPSVADGLPDGVYRDALDTLRGWRRTNADLLEVLSDEEEDALFALYWRLVRGGSTWKAFRLEAQNLRLKYFQPKSYDEQRRADLEAQARARLSGGSYMRGGW